ncbi:MAG: hypothetical protein VXX85_06620 [Candidatus Margulisiibacteriota bacterium]|nr:hypothetical protein [Candidatus Margulisiibacteriota bacterium]
MDSISIPIGASDTAMTQVFWVWLTENSKLAFVKKGLPFSRLMMGVL